MSAEAGDQVEKATLARLNVWLDEANHAGAQGQSQRTIALCRQVLDAAPDGPVRARALQMLGMASLQTGQFAEAKASLQAAYALSPEPAIAGYLGVCLSQLGDAHGGAHWLERALSQSPDNPVLLANLLQVRQQLQDHQAVIMLATRLLTQQPGNQKVRLSLARSLAASAHHAEAARVFEALVIQVSDQPRVWFELGMAHRASGDHQAAVRAYQRSLALNPQQPEVLTNLSVILQEQGAYAEALAGFEQANRLLPDHELILLNLAGLQLTIGRSEAAATTYARLLEAPSASPQALDGLIQARLASCDWQDLDTLLARYRDLLAAGETKGVSPFNSLFLPLSPQEQLLLAQHHSRRLEAKALPSMPASAKSSTQPNPPADRLRIGYLSADYREHILGDMIRELFSRHDRSRFEVFAYAFNGDDGSPAYGGFRQQAEHFRDLSRLSLQAADTAIRADRLDLLVYLGGYTDGDRAELLVRRPAPVQVSYLDYPATLGADWIDWLICDARVCPPEFADCYQERLFYLPDSYQLNAYAALPQITPPKRHEVGLPPEAFVFSCFCKPNRLTATRFSLWLRLLAAVPGSVLWLLQDSQAASERLRSLAAAAGIDPQRLIFAPNLPRAKHLARQSLADLFLDTACTNAHTTAADALWAGVPVVSLPGETFTSRVGLSLLHAVGLPELIVADEAGYEALALDLAMDPGRLSELRAYLLQAGRHSPLFKTASTVKRLETAYAMMLAETPNGSKAPLMLTETT